jgi:hypothetical protein
MPAGSAYGKRLSDRAAMRRDGANLGLGLAQP